MRLFFILMMVAGSAISGEVKRVPAQVDPMAALATQFGNEMQQSAQIRQEPAQCLGSAPSSDDAWCSWVCIDGKWSKLCR